VLDTRPSESKPDRGVVHWQFELLNQRDEVVLSMEAHSFYRRRP
jgi:acyl dehydratase